MVMNNYANWICYQSPLVDNNAYSIVQTNQLFFSSK